MPTTTTTTTTTTKQSLEPVELRSRLKTYVLREGTKCAIARHKKTFRLMCYVKAQNVPQHGTQRLMCHGKAQNVP
jgi:hypothetical protein